VLDIGWNKNRRVHDCALHLDIAILTRMKYNIPCSWKRKYNESLFNRLEAENR
jgi:hypothetical protein